MERGAPTAATGPVKRISISTVAHNEQRYDTVGDWVWHPQSGTLEVFVSDLGDWRLNMAVALHEQMEALLCINRNISQVDVEEFDLAHLDHPDPGMIPFAPYYTEHRAGNFVEDAFLMRCGLQRETEEEAIGALPNWAGVLRTLV